MAQKFSRYIFPLALAIVVYALAWAFTDLPPSPLRFTDEKIEMNVTAKSYAIDGWYRFRNVSPFDRRTRFFYPFPMEGADYPDHIEAFILQGGANVPLKFKTLSDGISYHLKVPARGEVQIIIRYVQKLLERRAKYIVTTTRTWRRPLDHAAFKICHSAEFENVRYTYPGRKTESNDNVICRLIEWRHHMPNKDIEIQWGD